MTQATTTITTTTTKTIVDDMREALFEVYNEIRPGIHVSDLTTSCPRKTAFRNIDARECTDKELNYYTIGRNCHEALQFLMKKFPGKYVTEKSVEYDDIEGHIDIFDEKNNIPYEMKTNRSLIYRGPKPTHLRQLRAYMAITGAKTGYLLYVMLLQFNKDFFHLVQVTMDEREKQEILQKLSKDGHDLRMAISMKDPKYARHVRDDSAFFGWDKEQGKKYNYMCKDCPYNEECLRMVNEEKKRNV